ncbi:hypothetical protein DFH11DRAFT_1727143 [Phellopilus nigrolimitatus]|nr:hypothetical protein DFH11DRAFT_1727143 [Phellopilus nigrolimitatus]
MDNEPPAYRQVVMADETSTLSDMLDYPEFNSNALTYLSREISQSNDVDEKLALRSLMEETLKIMQALQRSELIHAVHDDEVEIMKKRLEELHLQVTEKEGRIRALEEQNEALKKEQDLLPMRLYNTYMRYSQFSPLRFPPWVTSEQADGMPKHVADLREVTAAKCVMMEKVLRLPHIKKASFQQRRQRISEYLGVPL